MLHQLLKPRLTICDDIQQSFNLLNKVDVCVLEAIHQLDNSERNGNDLFIKVVYNRDSDLERLNNGFGFRRVGLVEFNFIY
ncbi:17440_t:CDS:2 [Funneliformis geosporum]|uniref:4028_t:CDS:1 n=1 Tax=Funneliformis geosporum TaxID=1117311 RepID=A0A9W4SHT6_9GLOM|nr:17440_t:CDS:2 [Funneliformis geosporum]CAI2169973.1 4028_t:CDS:2 [Funneliformis geosporum]